MTEIAAPVAVATEPKIVNFLDFSKKTPDWRYEFHRNHFMKDVEESIHWIASIDLSRITSKTTETPLVFIDQRLQPVEDYEIRRHEDGASAGGHNTYRYNIDFPELKQRLLLAKADDYQFFNIFIEEKCNGYGIHSVSLLYSPEAEPSKNYGFESKVILSEMSYKDLYRYTHQQLHPSYKKLRILGHGQYHWHK